MRSSGGRDKSEGQKINTRSAGLTQNLGTRSRRGTRGAHVIDDKHGTASHHGGRVVAEREGSTHIPVALGLVEPDLRARQPAAAQQISPPWPAGRRGKRRGKKG